MPEETIPHKGLSIIPIFEAIHAGKIKGLLAISSNPMVSLPNNSYIREAFEKLEFFSQIDFFMSETARYADVVLAGSLMEEDEGTTTNVEGRVIHHKKVVDPPGDARVDWKIICDIAARLGQADKFTFDSPKEIFDELRVASKGGICDYYGITWDRIDREYGVCWPCPVCLIIRAHPGFMKATSSTIRTAKPIFNRWSGSPRPKKRTTSIPSFLRPAALSPTTFPERRRAELALWWTSIRNRCVRCIPSLAAKLGIAEGDFVKVESRRGSVTVRASVVKTIRPDTVFVPYHWPLDRAANNMTVRAIDPISNIPEYKICAVRVSKVPAPHDAIAELEMEAGGVR